VSVRAAIIGILRSEREVRAYDLMEELLDLAFREKRALCRVWVAWEEGGRVVHWCTGAAEVLKELEREGLVEIVRDDPRGHNVLIRARGPLLGGEP